jgi:hypothetical protein
MCILLTFLLLLCPLSTLVDVQEVAAQDMEQWQGQLEAFKKQLHVEKQQGEAAVELAAARLTIAEGQELEARCQEVRWRAVYMPAENTLVGEGATSGVSCLTIHAVIFSNRLCLACRMHLVSCRLAGG